MRTRSRLRIVRVTTSPIQVRETASVDLPRDAETVWSFMWDPASSLELNDAEVAAALPGKRGLGEIQAFVHPGPGGRAGFLHEVIEFDPGRRAVTRSLVGWCPNGTVLTIEPLGPDWCRVRQEFWADFPAGVAPEMEPQQRRQYRQRLDLLMHRLAGWAARRHDDVDFRHVR
jgi:hypothetical protein